MAAGRSTERPHALEDASLPSTEAFDVNMKPKAIAPMTMKLNTRDIASAVLLIAFAAIGLYLNRDYPEGSASQMGPGYMPMLVFWLLGGLGAVVLVVGLKSGPDALEKWAWRELGLILGSMTIFAALLEHIGLALAVVALVTISSLADRSQTIKGTIAGAVVLVAVCWLVFIVGLDISVPFLPPFLGYR
jgi:hypothetical protein